MSDPTERRREQRRTITLRARIAQMDGLQYHCTVRDYCSGGLLVQWLPPANAEQHTPFEVAQTIELRAELLTDTGSRAIRIKAAIAWLRDTHLGLQFSTPSTTLFDALQKHDHLARSDTPGTPAVHTGSEVRKLAKLRHVAQHELPPILRELLVKTGRDLLQATDDASSNSEQQHLFEDMHALEELRQSDSLTREILSAALDPVAVRPAGAEGEGLSLVDNKEFECWLEASRVATMLDGQFSAHLNNIGSRLAGLRTSQAPGVLSVPFEPQHFTGALQNLVRELNLCATSRAVLFDSAATILGNTLGGFYGQLNATLDAMGAVPVKLNTVAGKPGGQQRQPETTNDSKSTDTPELLVASAHPRDAVVSAAQGGGPVMTDPELLQAVHAHEAQQRETQARELMAFVSNVSNMTESLQAWLNKLGEPMMRKAIADVGFFHNPKDPLREIVDGLGHLQMFRANPDADPANDPVRKQVTELLQPISRGESDEETLRSIAQNLNALNSHQSRHYQRNVERVAKSSEGRDRVRRIRLAVATEINRRYAGHQVPELLPELLEIGWRALLELSWLKSEDGDALYEERLDLLDAVVAQLGGESFANTSSDIDIQALFAQIQLELADAAFDPFRRHTLEKRLRRELSSPHQNTTTLIEMPALEIDDDREDQKSRPKGISEAAWQRLIARCELLAVGDRVSLLDGKEGRMDLRIAWIRRDGGAFSLVDHRGLKVSDIRLSKLVHGLHCRRIELDRADGRPLSERAIDAILERMEERLSREAAHDSLTGLINRQQFHAALEQAVTMPGQAQNTGVLLWIDLDQFRLVNEIHGYDTGDRLLIAVARLLEQVKGTKVLAHVGADRFGLFLPDIALDDGERCAQAICKSVRDMPFEWTGQPFALAASIGVVGKTVAQRGFGSMLQAAESALDAVKSAGGNNAFVYHEDDPSIARRKDSVQWLAKVDEALERGQLRLRCQPIVPVRPNSGLAPHYEVLLGVNNGSAEPLPIGQFIEAAERYNRMRAVDRWVARTTMEWIAANRAQMPALHGFAVNLSGQTANDPGFVEFVRQQFQRTGIDPSWVSFEVTETAAVADLSCAAGIIRDLKMMGCQVALDDFGSGQASYSYLKELPVDWLKIDGAFVRKIAHDAEDYAVVKSINEIGHFMGKKTIAEYVANDAILRSVREIGVDFAQGFGICPPMLMDDLLQTAAIA